MTDFIQPTFRKKKYIYIFLVCLITLSSLPRHLEKHHACLPNLVFLLCVNARSHCYLFAYMQMFFFFPVSKTKTTTTTIIFLHMIVNVIRHTLVFKKKYQSAMVYDLDISTLKLTSRKIFIGAFRRVPIRFLSFFSSSSSR
jgi:hypothetical protein